MTSSAPMPSGQQWGIGVALLTVGLLMSLAATRTHHSSDGLAPADDELSAVTSLTWLLGATAASAFGAGVMSTGGLTATGLGPFVLAGLIVVVPVAIRSYLQSRHSDG